MEPALEGRCRILNLFSFPFPVPYSLLKQEIMLACFVHICSCFLILYIFSSSVKQEPEEVEIKKTEATFRPPPLPEPEVLPDLLQRWSLSKGEELLFIQLPDSLPGQPPTKEHRPVKTEVQSADGQSVLLKTESQVGLVVYMYIDTACELCLWTVILFYFFVRKRKLKTTAAIWKISGRVLWERCLCGSLAESSSS